MGSCLGTSGITINLHQHNFVYFTDETLSGIVNWYNKNDTFRTKEIYIMLIGEVGYTKQEIVSNGRGVSAIRTDYHRAQIYTSKMTLAQAQSEDEMMLFKQGQYSWPFQLPLTNRLPPTFNSPGHYPHVKYYLQVVVEKPWYKPDTKVVRYLTVYPRLNLLQNPQWLQQTLFEKQSRKDISLKGFLNKTGLVPGESFDFTIEINNPKEVLIKHIDLSFYQFYTVGENSNRKEIFQTQLPNIQQTNRREIKEVFSVIIPDVSLPPSYDFHGGIKKFVSVRVQYFAKLAVKVGGIFANFDIDLPIIVATEPRSHSYQPSASALPCDDLPPSYESVVQNTE